MTVEGPRGLFVTGAGRSGTSLLDKLLSAHPRVAVLSQPLPLLYVALKRRFLEDRAACGAAVAEALLSYPLSDLFDEHYTDPGLFTDYLTTQRLAPDWLAGVLRTMADYDGQYFKPDKPVEALVPETPLTLADFLTFYARKALGGDKEAYLGAKETFAEAYVPYFLSSGTKVILLLRDPRDVVASVFTGRGPELAGAGRPLLFVLRQWRKSVAFALAYRSNPNLRVLRYEDLVGDPRATLDGIAEWLGRGAFPEGLDGAELRTLDGAAWTSNASHRATRRISSGSVGAHRRLLSERARRAIDVLCGPEMRTIGYPDAPPSDGEERREVLNAFEELCSAPRPDLTRYLWSERHQAVELERLEALERGCYLPRRHILPRAFTALARGTGRIATVSPATRPVHERRAATILYNLVRRAKPGLVLLPANICPEVPLAVATAGRKFRFVDIDPETLCMDAGAARTAVGEAGSEIAAVVYARTYGALFDAAPLFARLKETDPGLLVIDDRCACRPNLDDDGVLDPNVDAVVFSTGQSKVLDLGGGGFGVLRPGTAYESHRRPYDPAQAAGARATLSDLAKGPGARLTPDALLRSLLGRWPHWLEATPPDVSWRHYEAAIKERLPAADRHKAALNAIYRRVIPREAWLGAPFDDWRFTLRTPDKGALMVKIFAAGTFASGHYRPGPQLFGGPPAPQAEALYDHVVNLFNDRHADAAHARKAATIVRQHLTGRCFDRQVVSAP